MYENTVTLTAQDLVHYCAAIIHELVEQVDPALDIPDIGGDMLADYSGSVSIKSMRELLISNVEKVSQALEAHDTKSALALELRRVLKGKRSGAGLLCYAIKLWKTLIIIERNFNPRADFVCGCVWNTDDQEIVKPESRDRLDGSKIQEPVKGATFVNGQLLEVQTLPAPSSAVRKGLPSGAMTWAAPYLKAHLEAAHEQAVSRATDLGIDLNGEKTDRILDLIRALEAYPEVRLQGHALECLRAREIGAPIPKAHQYTASESLGLRSSTEIVPASASGEYTRARPFGQCTRFLSDGTPVGFTFAREVLQRLSESEGPFDHVSDPLGYWIARPGPDCPAMSQNPWRVVEVIKSETGFHVLETGESDPSDPKGWVFSRKVEIES